VLGCVCAERIARVERLLDATPSPPPMPTAPEKDRAKRELEREALHLGMPRHLGSPGIARMDPLDRYERRALSRRNRAVQKFLEMFGVSTRTAHERVDPQVPASGSQSTIEIL
jgi:hypothetical protein